MIIHYERHYDRCHKKKRWTQTIRIMKLTLSILCLFCVTAFGRSYSQQVTISAQNESLVNVIKQMRQQSDYAFVFRADQLRKSVPVNVVLRSVNMEDALKEVFKNQPLEYEISEKTIYIKEKPISKSIAPTQSEEEQQDPIRGRVIDESGEPLAGTTIRIKGTDITYVTDRNGYFEMPYTYREATLTVEYIGYRQVEVTAQRASNITLLADQSELDNINVVYTGYQPLPKERATGSFSKVDNETFNRQVSTDVISRLKGIAPSILFDERSATGPKLTIRGQATIFGNDQPLIIVDNFPYEGDINNINPNDIEEIDILKDAAAASIWGVRAGNGVIVIKTKKGQINQPMNVSLTANATFGGRPDLWYIPQMETTDFIDIERMLFENGHYNTIISNTAANRPYSPVVEILNDQEIGVITSEEAETRINKLRDYDLRNDIHKYLYEPSLNQQYTLNLSGGTNKYSYYFSSGFDKNRETEKGNGFSRISINSNQTFRPIDKLEITAGLTYNQNNRQSANVASMLTNMGQELMYPYARLVDDDGNPAIVIKDHSTVLKEKALTEGLLNWDFVPLNELALQDNKNRQLGIRLNTAVKYDILDQLSAEVRFQYENQLNRTRNLTPMESYIARDQINRYTTFPGNIMTRNIPLGGMLNNTNNELNVLNGRFQLNYNQDWNKHHINAIAGFEVREAKASGTSNRLYGFDSNVGTNIAVDYTTLFTQYGKGTTSGIPNVDDYSHTLDRIRSYYINAAYNYDLRYVLSGSARIDQSNLFGVSTNQKSVPLWSAGLKWNINKEAFYNLDWLPEVSIRSTYGYSGNVDRTITAYTTAMLSTNSLNRLPMAGLLNPPNKNLRWEKNRMWNIGIDFALVDQRLSGSIEYFNRKGTDLIGNGAIDPTTGFISYRGNLADMEGKGVDVELNSVNIRSRDFTWRTVAIFSYAKDKVTEYQRMITLANFVNDNSIFRNATSYSPVVGRPLFSIYSYPWAGLDPETGQARGYLDDLPSTQYSQITQHLAEDPENNLIYHGNALAPYFGALRNTFDYKRIELSFNITYRFGYSFKRNSIMYSALYSSYGIHGDFYNRWQSPGDELITDVPAMVYPAVSLADQYYRNSEVLVSKGDHIRLQDVVLSYTVNPRFLNNLSIKNLRVFAIANNVGILWKANKVNLDPDFPNVKPTRTIAFGLNSNF